MMNYKKIAIAAGYSVENSLDSNYLWLWFEDANYDNRASWFYETEQEAWKACCVEKGLIVER
jgi:hypothetical protein